MNLQLYHVTILYKLAKCFTLHISSTGLCQWNPVNFIQSGPALVRFPMAKILDRVTARHMGGVNGGAVSYCIDDDDILIDADEYGRQEMT